MKSRSSTNKAKPSRKVKKEFHSDDEVQFNGHSSSEENSEESAEGEDSEEQSIKTITEKGEESANSQVSMESEEDEGDSIKDLSKSVSEDNSEENKEDSSSDGVSPVHSSEKLSEISEESMEHSTSKNMNNKRVAPKNFKGKSGTNKFKGSKKYKEDTKKYDIIVSRRKKHSEPMWKETKQDRGFKTDRDYDDFVNEPDESYKSQSEPEAEQSESSVDEDIKEEIKLMDDEIKKNLKPTCFVDEDNISDTSGASPKKMGEELDDFAITNPKKKAGTIKRNLDNNSENGDGEILCANKYDNQYDLLLNRLQLHFMPESLPCREKEKDVIQEFIQSGLRNRGSSTSLYISGMPGTGKTATTLECIKKLNNERKKKFKFIHVNGMQLNNSSVMYSLIYKEITGQKHKPTTAAVLLDEYFKKKDKSESQLKSQQMIVLLVDELDALVTKKQTLLYNLFDWPSNKNSGLIILAIANTMDLPERFLVKIKSRIGESRLVYQPYSRNQIEKIIRSRVPDKELFKKDSIKMIATKVSSLSGDIRRALQVCKRATEMAKHEAMRKNRGNQGEFEMVPIEMTHIQKAFIELYNSKNTLLLKALRKYEKLVILGVMIEASRGTGQDKVKLSDIINRVTGMAENLGYDRLSMSEIMEILLRLKSFGVVAITNEKPKLDNIHIQAFVYVDEIVRAYEGECEIYEKNKDLIK